jgi:hypothetical protein
VVVVVLGSAVASSTPTPAPPKESIVLVPPHLEPRRTGPELDAIVAVLETTKPALLACFTKVADDEVSANITLTVATDGAVTMVETPPVMAGELPLSEDSAACVVHTFLKLKFDAPKERTHVIFPMAFHRRRAPVTVLKPTLVLDVPIVSGALAATAVDPVVRKTTSKLLACVAKVTADVIKTNVTFTIGRDGKVTTTTENGMSDDVAACVTAIISKLTFASSKETTDVVYPITFGTDVELVEQGRIGILGSTGTTAGGAFVSLTGTGDISSGFDDSNDASGWGTIGTGRYGTIGHGSGSGTGYGKGTHPVPPLVSIGQPTVTGDLDKAIVRRYIKRNVQKLQYCYEKELLVTKTLHGTVTAEFTITQNGAVDTSTASGIKNKNVESCVAAVIKNIEFPKPKGGSSVTVTYPMTFTPPPPPAPAKTK